MPLFASRQLTRFYPVAAFFGGFLWDALTIGQRVRSIDLIRLSAFLVAAALLILWLARRDQQASTIPEEDGGWRSRLARVLWRLPEWLLPFFFGGIFSALFIFYFKSAGHWAAWLVAAFLGLLLIANEFWGQRYGRRFSLTWGLFALNAILLANFILPYAIGSLSGIWFVASTLAGAALAHLLYRLAGRPGRITPAWWVALVLLMAWWADMIAPVPLVKRGVAVGQRFEQVGGAFKLWVEPAPIWAFWREQSEVVHLDESGRLYAVSAVYAPKGIAAALEHRWERKEAAGWQIVSRIRFQASGGREQGFRGYSYVNNPAPGDWRLVVATQDGRTIATEGVRVELSSPDALVLREF